MNMTAFNFFLFFDFYVFINSLNAKKIMFWMEFTLPFWKKVLN